jgi:hypothetical protein
VRFIPTRAHQIELFNNIGETKMETNEGTQTVEISGIDIPSFSYLFKLLRHRGELLFLRGCVPIINIFCLFACNYRSLVQNIAWFFNKK